ncbi:MAG TPA: NUDIX domain-containing protein [Acidimicrobiales bacterium]|nr:NUDIX domain-containing protein [Acidimicrobiales bacterium]
MTRIEHYEDPDAPPANSLVPAASAVVRDDRGRILITRRADNNLWTIPGGRMEPGETIAETAEREVREETGISVEVDGLVGIYSNPRHVIEYADGEVRQQFSVCFSARPRGGSLAESPETTAVAFVEPAELDGLDIHPSIRLRIQHALEVRSEPYLG